MQLVCPNCSAQYDIDAALIPAEGRDVQCASCDHVWLQKRPEETAPLVLANAEPSADIDLSERIKGTSPGEAAPEETPDDLADAATPDSQADESPTAEKRSYSADEIEVRENLREAVAEEIALKDRDESSGPDPVPTEDEREELTASPESPLQDTPVPDAPLAEAPTPATEEITDGDDDLMQSLRAELATVKDDFNAGEVPRSNKRSVVAAAASAGIDTKKLLAPDTRLRTAISKELAEEFEQDLPFFVITPRRRKRAGFLVGLFVVAVAFVLYLFSAQLAAAVPALEPYLKGYVSVVDAVRSAIEALYAQVMVLINGETAG